MQNTMELVMAPSGFGGFLDAMLKPLAAGISDLTQLVFFQRINTFLVAEIDTFRENVLERATIWVGGIALMALTVWILFQGFRIVTGQSRDSLTIFAGQAVKNAFILSAAMSMAVFGTDINGFLSEGLVREIHQVVTGSGTDPYSKIDESLGYMQLALSSIDALDVGGDALVNDAKTRAQWFSGIGIAGPAIIGGAMLLLYRLAMALFVGFGPIFIACLMFESTKPLFQKWLLYGIGTMFSLAVLSFTVSLALDVITAVAASYWVGSFLGASNEGISSTALQQGGIGLILTMLIVSAPPIAGNFFQATLANFSSYNQFAGGSQSPPGKPNVNAYNNNSYNQQQQRNETRQEQPAPTQAPTQFGYNNPATNPNYGTQQTAPQQTGLRGTAAPPPKASGTDT